MTPPSSPGYIATYTLDILGPLERDPISNNGYWINVSEFEKYLFVLDQANCSCEIPTKWHFPEVDLSKEHISPIESSFNNQSINRYTTFPKAPPCRFCGESERYTCIKYICYTPEIDYSLAWNYSAFYRHEFETSNRQFNRDTRASQASRLVKKISQIGCDPN